MKFRGGVVVVYWVLSGNNMVIPGAGMEAEAGTGVVLGLEEDELFSGCNTHREDAMIIRKINTISPPPIRFALSGIFPLSRARVAARSAYSLSFLFLHSTFQTLFFGKIYLQSSS